MATIFTKLIEGELPAHFVWKDDHCVAFLSINPLATGHTLVVPRAEIDHWLDLPEDLRTRVMDVSHAVGRALQQAYDPVKVGLMLAGLEVPHTHVHLVPIWEVNGLDFARADPSPDPAALGEAAETVRSALTALGYDGVASGS